MSLTYIVTGTSRGIGLEFVNQLAAKGHTVFALLRDTEASEELKALVDDKKVFAIKCDARSVESAEEAAKEVEKYAPVGVTHLECDLVLHWLVIGDQRFETFASFFQKTSRCDHLPAWLIFNYYFAIMKVYALFMLHEVGWGTRAVVGTTLAADIEKQGRQEAEEKTSRNLETIKEGYDDEMDEKELVISQDHIQVDMSLQEDAIVSSLDVNTCNK